MSRASEGTSEPSRDVGRAGSDVEEHRTPDAEAPHVTDEKAFERPCASPPPMEEGKVPEREAHLFLGDVRIIENLVGWSAGRYEETHESWLITSALFFDPNPIVLQRACSKDVSRDSLAT